MKTKTFDNSMNDYEFREFEEYYYQLYVKPEDDIAARRLSRNGFQVMKLIILVSFAIRLFVFIFMQA